MVKWTKILNALYLIFDSSHQQTCIKNPILRVQ